MLRIAKNLAGGVNFHNLTAIHNGNTVTQKPRHPEVMGNKQIS
jgi:hypothetical protein